MRQLIAHNKVVEYVLDCYQLQANLNRKHVIVNNLLHAIYCLEYDGIKP